MKGLMFTSDHIGLYWSHIWSCWESTSSNPNDAPAIRGQEPREQNWLCSHGGREDILFMLASYVAVMWMGIGKTTLSRKCQNKRVETVVVCSLSAWRFSILSILSCFSAHYSCTVWPFSSDLSLNCHLLGVVVFFALLCMNSRPAFLKCFQSRRPLNI